MASTDLRDEDGQLKQDGVNYWYWWDTVRDQWIGPFNSEQAARFNHIRVRRGTDEARKAFNLPVGWVPPDLDYMLLTEKAKQQVGLDAQEANYARSCVGKEGDRGPVVLSNEPEGIKYDSGKAPWDLAPWDALGAIIEILAFGARKYEARNWEKGMAWSRCYAGAMRHLTAWWMREDKDPETGLSHLAHASCCILFLLAYEIRSKGKDDRP